jgi:uncharacterized protein YjbI with pentapeptide repeats
MKRLISVLALSFFTITNSIAQQIDAYPSNWFANMNYNKVQLLLRSTSVDFSNATLTGVKFENCDLSKSIFDATNLEKTDFSTAVHFSIHPENNTLSKTKFSNENLSGLLNKYDLDII